MKTFRLTLGLSILLIVGGFICPPMGVIDGSVLTAVGLLLAFATLAQLPLLIEAASAGKRIRLQKGDFSAEVSSCGYGFAPVGRVVDDGISNSGCRFVGPRVSFRCTPLCPGLWAHCPCGAHP